MPIQQESRSGDTTFRQPILRWLLAGVCAVVLLLGAILIVLLVDDSDEQAPQTKPAPRAQEPEIVAGQGGQSHEATKLHASNPYEAVRRVYEDVAEGSGSTACLRFDERARQQFSKNLGFATCDQAAAALSGRVTDVNAYAESLPSAAPDDAAWAALEKVHRGGTLTVDSCTAAATNGGVKGGPALGTFAVTRLADAAGEQWLISDHKPGPTRCS